MARRKTEVSETKTEQTPTDRVSTPSEKVFKGFEVVRDSNGRVISSKPIYE